MAHPAYIFLFDPVEQVAFFVLYFALAVLFRGSGHNFSARGKGEKLRAVADAEHGYSQAKQRLIGDKRVFRKHGIRSARQDDADGIDLFDFFDFRRIRQKFGIHAEISDSSCDQLVILSAEVQNNYCLIFHFPSKRSFVYSKRNYIKNVFPCQTAVKKI